MYFLNFLRILDRNETTTWEDLYYHVRRCICRPFWLYIRVGPAINDGLFSIFTASETFLRCRATVSSKKCRLEKPNGFLFSQWKKKEPLNRARTAWGCKGAQALFPNSMVNIGKSKMCSSFYPKRDLRMGGKGDPHVLSTYLSVLGFLTIHHV